MRQRPRILFVGSAESHRTPKEIAMTVSAVSPVAQTSPAPVPAAVATPVWTLDASHSHVGFAVRHLMISNVRGEFTELSGQGIYDPKHPDSAEVTVRID